MQLPKASVSVPDVPASLRNIPVIPVAMALVVGFSVGLAVSIAIDAKKAQAPRLVPVAAPVQPCSGCAERAAAGAPSDPVTVPDGQ